MAKAASLKVTKPFRPLGVRILLEPATEGETIVHGIIVPSGMKQETMERKVTHIGPDVKHVKVGETVLVGKYAGTDLKSPDYNGLLVNEEEILAVIG